MSRAPAALGQSLLDGFLFAGTYGFPFVALLLSTLTRGAS